MISIVSGPLGFGNFHPRQYLPGIFMWSCIVMGVSKNRGTPKNG